MLYIPATSLVSIHRVIHTLVEHKDLIPMWGVVVVVDVAVECVRDGGVSILV